MPSQFWANRYRSTRPTSTVRTKTWAMMGDPDKQIGSIAAMQQGSAARAAAQARAAQLAATAKGMNDTRMAAAQRAALARQRPTVTPEQQAAYEQQSLNSMLAGRGHDTSWDNGQAAIFQPPTGFAPGTHWGLHPGDTNQKEWAINQLDNPFVSGQMGMSLYQAVHDPLSQYLTTSYAPMNFRGPLPYQKPDEAIPPGELPPPPGDYGFGSYDYGPYSFGGGYGGGYGGGNADAYAWMSKLMNWNANKE